MRFNPDESGIESVFGPGALVFVNTKQSRVAQLPLDDKVQSPKIKNRIATAQGNLCLSERAAKRIASYELKTANCKFALTKT